MLKRYFFFILALSVSLYAADEYPFYVWGDAKSIKNQFDSIAMILQDNTFINALKYIAVLASVLHAGKWLVQENYKMAGLEIAYVMALMTLVYQPATTVHIVDKRTNIQDANISTYYNVDHIPFALSFTAYTSSVFTQFMVEEIDTVSTSLNSLKYGSTGFMFTNKIVKTNLIDALGSSYRSDGNVTIVSNYINECFLKNIPDIDPKAVRDVYSPNGEIKTYLDPNILGINNKTYSTTQNCSEYWANADNSGTSVSTAIDNIGKTIGDTLMAKMKVANTSTTESDLLKIYSPLGKLSSFDIAQSNLATSAMLGNGMEITGIGVPGIDTATRGSIQASKMQLLQNGSGQFAWMADMLPKAVHLLTAIVLMSYILMGVVAAFLGMQKGYRLVANYIAGFIAFQSIHIAFALVQNIVNYYTQKDAASQLVSFGGTPTGYLQIPQLVQYMSDMTGLAGLLGVASIPLVLGIMYKGEVAAASGVAMGVGSAFKSLGVAGSMDQLSDNFGKNATENNHKSRETDEERKARERLARAGIEVPTNGSAIQQMAKFESEIENANKANASFSAMTSPGGATALNAGAGVSSYGAESTKLAAGRNAVTIEGGELSAISLAQSAGAVDGMRSSSAIFAKGSEAQRLDGMYGSGASETIASAAGVAEGIKEMGSITGAGTQAIREGIATDNGKIGKGEGLGDYRTSSELNSAKDIASATAYGHEINSDKGLGFANAVYAAKLKAIQDSQSEMATGKFGNDEDFRQVSSQNAEIAAKAINNTAKRRNQLDGKDGTEAWSADKIAEGQAIDSVQNEIKQQGVFNALKKEKQSDDDAFRQAAMGSEFAGRKSENELLGIGKEWTKRTATGDDIKTMSKVQDNTAAAALGGIDATHAELMEHGGVHGAIRDMVTQAQKKGIESAADAKTLRKKYDTDHDGDIDDAAAVVSDSQRSAAMESKKNALKKLNDKISNGGFDMSDQKEKAEFERLSNTIKSADATINNRDKMGLSEQAELIANQKLESQLGQAEGIKKNINGGGVNYAQNAMYSEMSKQQSTAAKIDAQGGVDASVRTDILESTTKATQQQQALLGATQQYLQSAAGGSHSKEEAQRMARAIMDGGKGAAEFLKQAMSGAGALAFAQSGAKTGSAAESLDKFNSAQDFVENEKEKASQAATVDKRVFDRSRNQEASQNVIDGIMEQAGVMHKSETAKRLVSAGLAVVNENGDLVATTGKTFRDGMAALSSGDMDTTKQLVIDGQRFNVDRDGVGNGVLVNRDSSENTKGGRDAQTSVLGYLGDVGGFVGEALVGAIGVDAAAKKMGISNGVIKPIINKGFDLMGMKQLFNSSNNNGPDKNHSETEQPFDEQSKNTSGEHDSSLNKDTNSIPKNGETSKSAAAKQKIDNIQERMSNLSSISDADLGRQNLVAKIDDALEGATDPKERKALNQLKNDVLDGKSIDKRAVKKAGLDARDFITKGEKVEYTDKETGEKKSFTKDTIDFDTEGRESKRYQSRQLSEELSSANKEYSEAKVAEIEQKAAEKKEFNKKAHVNENGRVTGVGESGKPNSYNPDIPEAREAYLKTNEGASSPVDAKKPFSFSKAMDVMEEAAEQSHGKGWTGKAGAALTAFAGYTAASTLFGGSDAEASTLKTPPPPKPKNVIPEASYEPSSSLETINDTASNTELGVGLGTMVTDAMSKYSGAALKLAKFGAKVAPGVSVVAGAADIAYRESQGDHLGAGMSAGIAAVAQVPVVGTGLAIAGTVAQTATDYLGITGGGQTPAPQSVKPMESVAQTDSVPQYAQAAFAQPPAYNTMQAMTQNPPTPTVAPDVQQAASQISSGQNSGYMYSMMAEGKAETASYAAKTMKTTIEGASNNYIQNEELIEAIQKNSKDDDEHMSNGIGND